MLKLHPHPIVIFNFLATNFLSLKNIMNDLRFQHVFEFHQENNSGFLKPFSFKAALNAAGFKIDERVLNLLAHRYATKGWRCGI